MARGVAASVTTEPFPSVSGTGTRRPRRAPRRRGCRPNAGGGGSRAARLDHSIPQRPTDGVPHVQRSSPGLRRPLSCLELPSTYIPLTLGRSIPGSTRCGSSRWTGRRRGGVAHDRLFRDPLAEPRPARCVDARPLHWTGADHAAGALLVDASVGGPRSCLEMDGPVRLFGQCRVQVVAEGVAAVLG